jgi:peptidoglycan/xylan/chitin deacetylase (PgdA/CDA1 family)
MSSRCVKLVTQGPIVSFTFDDFPRTALTIGGQILKDRGCRGTYYAAVGLMNRVNHLGDQFTRKDLETLMRDGHELASHTHDHVSCRSISCSSFRENVERGRRALEELTGSLDFGNFAFPFGDVTLRAKKYIGQDVASSRSIWGGLNAAAVDLNLLRANSLYGDSNNVPKIRELIIENARQKSWLIFYSHDVRNTPSRYGCTPDLLKSAVEIAQQSGARIATVAEVVSGLTALPLEAHHSLTYS